MRTGGQPGTVRRLRDYAVDTWVAMAGDAVRGGIEVRVLGAFEVSVEGRPVVAPRGRVRALLASLALTAGRPVAVDVLVDRLWSAATPLSTRQSLQNHVWRLRRLLGEDAVVGEAQAYRLDIDRDAVDALWFTKLLEQPPARDRLDEALRLWRGEPLSGVDSESLRRDWAPLLTERYLAALEQRIDLDLAAGDPGALVAELQGLTAQHPLRESLWVRLMTALAGSGRDAEALQAYERARLALADSLGADPCLELRELHRRILVGEPIGPKPSGTAPAAESGAGPEAAGTVPRQLPSDIVGFVGRADRLAELDRLLDERADRSMLTVVVHGVGGVGKTALAVRWAHRVADRFPQGQLYLNLQGYGREEPIPAVQALGSLLRAVDVAPREIPVQLDERSALWRTTTAGRQLLILLDNARDADQVRPLLPGSDSVVVVTSRNQLRGLSARDGARSLQLHEMSDVEARTVLAHAAGADRVSREADVAGGLIALCGGLPLALRITAELAARSPGASLSDLAGELRAQRLETLADPDDDAADPRAVFSWSYRALGPAEARVFRLLSVHPGADFSLPAAAAVIGEPVPQARKKLSRLVAVHLLEQSGHRYRFHDLVREYAAECATADSSAAERDAGARRVLDWYLNTVSNARNALKLAATNAVMEPTDPVVAPLQFADQQQALTWFHTEASALLAATRYAADHGYPAHAEQLSGALHGWHELTQRLDEWLTVAELGYRSARSLDTRARYRAAHTMGVVLTYRDLLDDAEAYKQEALRHARALNDPEPVVTALTGLGVLHQRRGAWRAALEHWHEAMRTADEHDLRFQAAHCLLNIGAEEANNGLLEDGIRHSEEALALYRALGADFHQGLALSNLADNHGRAGRLDRAVECCDEAIALFKRADATPPIAFGMEMGAVYVKAGQHRTARLVLQPIADSLRGQTHPLLAGVQRLLSEADRAETGPLTSSR